MTERLAVVGAKMWTGRLASSLEKHANIKCAPVSELAGSDVLRLPLILFASQILRVGFRPGVSRPRGVLIDVLCILAILIGRQITFYWTGSDVQRATAMMASNGLADRLWGKPVSRYLVRRTRHFAGAPWLVEELDSAGIKARFFPFPSPTLQFEDTSLDELGWPAHFNILSYVPDHNHENYFGRELVAVARELPEVTFRIMGGTGGWCDNPPPNLVFLGWVDPVEAYAGATVLLRAVRHDALGGTVREALLCGRHVIYNYPHEKTQFVKLNSGSCVTDVENLVALLNALYDRFLDGELTQNVSGREWVMHNYNEQLLARRVFDGLFKR